jgi:hypothetical protein
VPSREIFIFLLFFVPFVNILLFKIFLSVTAPTAGSKELVFDRNPRWKQLDSLPAIESVATDFRKGGYVAV